MTLASMNSRTTRLIATVALVGGPLVVGLCPAVLAAQTPAAPQTTAKPATQQPAATAPSATRPAPTGPAAAPPVVNAAPTPADYVIGPDDVLQIVFWREKDLSAESAVVRPDGKISLPLVNDIQAAGLTPEELRKNVSEAAGRFVSDPSVTIVVKTINSRKVYVTGQVNKPGTFALTDSMTVLQMLALAGGLMEYADGGKIIVMRTEQGQTKSFKFNYKDVLKGKNLQQNILLKPGDTILVP